MQYYSSTTRPIPDFVNVNRSAEKSAEHKLILIKLTFQLEAKHYQYRTNAKQEAEVS